MISINGKTYEGNNVTVINDEVYIDGKRAESEDRKTIRIIVTGNVGILDVDNCEKMEIGGEVMGVTTKNGNVTIQADVTGNVTSKNGNIICRQLYGNATTKNGNIKHLKN